MNGGGVTIEGMGGLRRKFSELSGRGQRAALSKAMRVGGNVLKKAAKERARGFSRRIAKGIKVKTKIRRTNAEARVGFSGAGWFGVPWEVGWTAASGRHIPARPMLRPALDENEGPIVQVFVDALNESIDKVKARGL